MPLVDTSKLNEAGEAATKLIQSVEPQATALLANLKKLADDANSTVPEVKARILATCDGIDGLVVELGKSVTVANGILTDFASVVAGFKHGVVISPVREKGDA
jgi:ABC-type transporter Mla subunit MlaD